MDRIGSASYRTLKGESAYEIAVKNGFVGTEEEWLAALIGAGGGVLSVNSRTGNVTLSKTDVGLANADNTSDATKPISAPAQAVIDTKLPAADAPELIRDTIAAALVAESGVKIVVDDIANTITVFAYAPFDIRRFGAVANDPAVNNISAINAATAAAAAVGGGEVVIPDGHWYIDPAPGTVVNIGVRSNVSYRGLGPNSRIKVVNNAGDYRWIFCPNDATNTAEGYVEHVSFRHFVVDHNATGNTTCNINANTAGQATFAFSNFTDIVIDHVTLDPYTGTNPLRFYGSPYQANTLKITQCHFVFVRGASTATPAGRYDTSTIYASASNVTVSGNTFSYVGDDAKYPDGAIEIHGPLATVQGNIIDNFGVGTWIVAHTSAAMKKGLLGVVCTGNIYRRVGLGIGCFPASTNNANDEIVIADNVIHLDTASKPYRITPSGILIGDTSYGDVVANVTVHDNIIRYTTGDTRLTNTAGASIQWGTGAIHITGKVATRRVVVHDNIVDHAPGPGIRVAGGAGVAYSDIWIHHNEVVNCGSHSGINDSDRASLSLTGNAEYRGCLFENNRIIDTGTTALIGKYAWRVSGLTGTSKDVTVWRNIQRAVFAPMTELNIAAGTLKVDYGLTTQRPGAAIVGDRWLFYDMDLNKPLWSDGTSWRDAAGTVV